MESLIGPERDGVLWAVLLSAAAVGLWAEGTRWGRRLSGAVITLGAGFVLSNLRILPSQAGVYDTVWSVFVPLAIPPST